MLMQASAYLTHAIAFSAIIAGITFAIVRGGDLSLAVPLMGTYLFAGARLIPRFRRRVRVLERAALAGPAVDALEATLGYIDVTPTSLADK